MAIESPAPIHAYQQACSRCGQDLTDPASREVGIGPVCRRLDNHLLATRIPIDRPRAEEIIYGLLPLDADWPPHVVPRLARSLATIVKNSSAPHDWRAVVRDLEWVSSWTSQAQSHAAVLNLIEALGYVGLAAICRGEAAKGAATVFREGTSLCVAGPRNAAANAALKEIPGRRFHPASPPSKPYWSVPIAFARDFERVVAKHYPNHDADALSALVAQAEVDRLAMPTSPAAAAVPAKTYYAVRMPGGRLRTRTPYDARFVDRLRSMPGWKKWNPALKAWDFLDAVEAEVLRAAAEVYGAELPVFEEGHEPV